MTVVLETDAYRAELRPEVGGLIALLQVRRAEGWVDLLRPEPPEGGLPHGLAHFGCFPMVPFTNRLPQAWLPLGQGRVAFARNWPPEGIAHHGTGWGQVWRCVVTGPGSTVLETDICAGDGTMLGVATQDIELSPAGLSVRLSYRHTHGDPMPAGVGLHPWFHAPDGLDHTRFAATGTYVMGATHLAEGHRAQIAERRFCHGDAGFNGCFSGWDGQAVIARPSAGFQIALSGDCDLLHTYVATAFQAFCLEPVTHFPGAAQTGLDAPGQMQVMIQGAEISMVMRIGIM